MIFVYDIGRMCNYILQYAYFKLLGQSTKRAPQYWLWTHNKGGSVRTKNSTCATTQRQVVWI